MKKKTNEEFLEQLANITTTIQPLEEYKGTDIKIKCKCLIHNYIWFISPYKLLTGRGCPICGRIRTAEASKKTHKEFIAQMEKVNSNIEILDTYVANRQPVTCLCRIDGNIWKAKPADLLQGRGCTLCANRRRQASRVKPESQFLNEMSQIDETIIIKGRYINSTTKIECKCKVCGWEWQATPHNLLRGKGCPNCYESKGEKKIKNWLIQNKICFISQYSFDECKNVHKLKFDFYLPQNNICIEYDGEQHFYPVSFGCKNQDKIINNFINTQNNDKIKNKYCYDNHIKLIRIKYTDFNHIEEILQGEIKTINI